MSDNDHEGIVGYRAEEVFGTDPAGPLKITIAENIDIEKIKKAFLEYGKNMATVPLIITPMSCCDRCEVMEALPEPIKKKIDLLVQLGSNTRKKQ